MTNRLPSPHAPILASSVEYAFSYITLLSLGIFS